MFNHNSRQGLRIGVIASFATAGALLLGPVATASATNPPTAITQNAITQNAIAQTVIAQSELDSSEQVQRGFRVNANAPATLEITTVPGGLVTIKAKVRNAKNPLPLHKTATKSGKAVFAKLLPGVTYTVKSSGKTITAIPLTTPNRVVSLTVMTTDSSDSVRLTWQHVNTKAQGSVHFTLTAAPINATPSQLTVTAETNDNEYTLVGLDPDTRYEFSVTPRNTTGAGEPTAATMARSLHQINGTAPAVTPTPVTTPVKTPPTPAPAPGPTTRTIYVCPAGFADIGSNCEKTQDYTFTPVTETLPYTYHFTDFVVWHQVPATWDANANAYTWNCPSGSESGGGQWGVGVCRGIEQIQVKDVAPTSFTDNGTTWTKTTSVKDATPAGFTDNGTAWVATTAKQAQVVPA